MRKHLLIVFCLIPLIAGVAHADDPVPKFIQAAIPDARPVGHGRLTYMMLDIYDATLYAPSGHLTPGGPVALSLTYLRHLSGARIADRSADEIRKLGFTDEAKLDEWNAAMHRIFPDVAEQTNLTGLYTKTGATIFYRNGQKAGEIDDPQFGHWFFAIWLSPHSSDPDLHAKLVGDEQ